MNRETISTPLVVVLLIVLLGAIAYSAWPQPTNAPTVDTVSTTTPAAATTTQAAPTPKAAAPAKATQSQTLKDTMTVVLREGVIPFSATFILTLNANRSCSVTTYTVAFGDGTEKNIDVPRDQCAKPFVETVYHQYQKAGTYTAALLTRIIGGGRGTTLSQATITAKNPSYRVSGTRWGSFTISPPSGPIPLTVDFTLSAADGSEANGIYYTLMFGDGTSATFPRTSAPSLSHTYTSRGSYLVSVSRRTNCAAGVCSGSSSPLGSYSISVSQP